MSLISCIYFLCGALTVGCIWVCVETARIQKRIRRLRFTLSAQQAKE